MLFGITYILGRQGQKTTTTTIMERIRKEFTLKKASMIDTSKAYLSFMNGGLPSTFTYTFI